jgi:hypothetical protein
MYASKLEAMLRERATNILFGRRVASLLSDFGDLTIHGSYDLDFMTWPEIDACIQVNELNISNACKLLDALSHHIPPTSVLVTSTEQQQAACLLPNAILIDYRFPDMGREWKLDITIVRAEQMAIAPLTKLAPHTHHAVPGEYNRYVREKLTPETRKAIMHIKREVTLSSHYRKYRWQYTDPCRYFCSHDIYTAVLEFGVRSLAEFAAYIEGCRGACLASRVRRDD